MVIKIIGFIVGFSVIILLHEMGHMLVAKLFGVGVEEFSVGMGKVLLQKKIGETTYSLRVAPFGGFTKLAGENKSTGDRNAFVEIHPLKKICVLIAGAFVNLITGFLVFAICFSIMGTGNSTNEVAIVYPGSEAYQNNVVVGDVVKDIKQIEDEYVFTFIRDDEEYKAKFSKSVVENGITGMGYFQEKGDVKAVLARANQMTLGILESFRMILFQMFSGVTTAGEVMGPVQIAKMSGQAAGAGILTYLFFFGNLSVNLAIVNLLPLPAVDGGRIILAIVEMIRKKRMPEKVEGGINLFGAILLIILMLVVTINDVISMF